MAQSYEKAGVNLEAGYEVVRRIKKHVASTSRLGVMGNIGAFGGMFDLSALKVKEPVLVSGTDGVGTKLKLAFEMDKHDTIGIDAVAIREKCRNVTTPVQIAASDLRPPRNDRFASANILRPCWPPRATGRAPWDTAP